MTIAKVKFFVNTEAASKYNTYESNVCTDEKSIVKIQQKNICDVLELVYKVRV